MGNPHQGVSSFNPSWCFRPVPAAKDAGKRSPVDVGVGSVATSSTLPKSGRRLCRAKFSIPTSPKIGCMGQIKSNVPQQYRRPSPSSSSSSKSSSSSRGKSKLLPFTLAFLRRNSSRPQMSSGKAELKEDRATSSAAGRRISVDAAPPKPNNMDPPSLVVLRRSTRVGGEGSLWERRCGEVGLDLELERHSLQNVSLCPVLDRMIHVK